MDKSASDYDALFELICTICAEVDQTA